LDWFNENRIQPFDGAFSVEHMKVITVEQARVLDLVPLEELRPNFGVYIPEFVSAIMGRYGFTRGPEDLAAALKDGAKFLPLISLIMLQEPGDRKLRRR